MTTVADILAFINILAPVEMKEPWDNVGLNCGRMDKPVRRILVALDPFADVCEEALEMDADLLVTHHALIWTPGFVNDQTEQGRNTLFLIENNIACINAHTNLDCAPGGVNDILAEKLGLKGIEVVNPKGVDEDSSARKKPKRIGDGASPTAEYANANITSEPRRRKKGFFE